MHVIDIKDLSCIRQNRVLFKQLSFSVKAGECLHVTGPNACGKSSLLQLLCQLLKPHSGQIYWNKEFIRNNKNFILNLNYLGHKLGVKHELTVEENIHFITQLTTANCSAAQIDQAINFWGLAHLKDQRLQFLSAGQKQRVALTRLLLNPAKLWVLDEPYTSLDHSHMELLTQLMTEHLRKQGLIILTTHQALALETHLVKVLNLMDGRYV